MFFSIDKFCFKKLRKGLCNKKGSASVEHMLILPIVIVILMFVLKFSVGIVEKGQRVLEKMGENRKFLSQVIKDKRGSTTVFLCIFMTGFIILLTILCDATGLFGGKAYFDDCSLTSLISVSTAYNENLKKEYGLQAINKQDVSLIEGKLQDNFRKTVHDETGAMYPVKAEKLSMMGTKTLSDENELKGQVVKVAREEATKIEFDNFKERLQDGEFVFGSEMDVDGNVDGNATLQAESKQEKTVDKEVKEALSQIFGGSFLDNVVETESGLSFAQDVEQSVFDEGAELIDWLASAVALFNDNVAIGEYVLRKFSNRCSNDSGREILEAEYVITGKEDREKSCKKVENKIFALMYMINAKFFLTSPQYMAKTSEAVAKYSGGNVYVAAALEVIIPMAWISAESKLDVGSLIDGEKVPIKKTGGNWRTTSLERAGILSIINSVSGAEVEGDSKDDKTDSKAKQRLKGIEYFPSEISYKDCLRMFLLLESTEEKLSRIRAVIEKGVGITFDNLLTEIEIQTKGSISCLFTSGSWLPSVYKDNGSGPEVVLGNKQVINLGGLY